MPVVLERWNDDKMDALDANLGGLGEQMREQRQETRELRREVRAEMGELRGEMGELRADMKAGFERVDERFERFEERVGGRFERLQRMLLFGVISLTSSFVAGFAALIVLFAAKG